jgi:hypothetical protein
MAMERTSDCLKVGHSCRKSQEICDNYSIIAYYFQRPAMNEKFATRVTTFNDNSIPEEVYKMNSTWVAHIALLRSRVEFFGIVRAKAPQLTASIVGWPFMT